MQIIGQVLKKKLLSIWGFKMKDIGNDPLKNVPRSLQRIEVRREVINELNYESVVPKSETDITHALHVATGENPNYIGKIIEEYGIVWGTEVIMAANAMGVGLVQVVTNLNNYSTPEEIPFSNLSERDRHKVEPISSVFAYKGSLRDLVEYRINQEF